MISSGKISHRNRKNPHSREEWQARKKAANAARGTQFVMRGWNEAVGNWTVYTHERHTN